MVRAIAERWTLPMTGPRHLGHRAIRYGCAEYLAYERDSGLEHECAAGEILTMAVAPAVTVPSLRE